MAIIIKDQIDPGRLMPGEPQAAYDVVTDSIDVAQEDYWETAGIYYSRVRLSRHDVNKLVQLFDMKDKGK